MVRIAGVYLQRSKSVRIALTGIFGVGKAKSMQIAASAGIDPAKKVRALGQGEVSAIRKAVQEHKVEGDLRRVVTRNIRRLLEIRSWRGRCHRRHLPVRGQRNKTNARTRKDRRA
jgi:small subunit ribosomal protein S13